MKKNTTSRLCLALALLILFQGLGTSLLSAESSYPPYLIGPGDLLSVSLYTEQDFPSNYQVDTDGTVYFPLLGETRVSGLTQGQLSELLRRRLGAFIRNPQVTALITSSSNYNVAVWGDVVRPGKYLIRGRPTLISLMGDAGGPLNTASLGRAVLIRGEKKTGLDLNYYLKDIGPTREFILMPGDVVYVPRSHWPTLGEWGILFGILTSGILIANSLGLNHDR